MEIRIGSRCVLVALMATIATPASADDTAKIGLAAALGLEAADGKTSITGGAGSIEAGLLATEGFRQTGAMIASMVNRSAGGRTVLALARDQTVNLAMVQIVDDRISQVTRLLGRANPCVADKPAKALGVTDGVVPPVTTPMVSDIAGAIATSISIAPVVFSVDDRLLLNAIMIGRANTSYAPASEWTVSKDAATVGQANFRLPGEVTDASYRADGIRARYLTLLAVTDQYRQCSSDVAKAAVAAADALVTSLNTVSDKSPTSPLATAVSLDAFRSPDPAKRPLVLRVAVEQTGGPSIARSGILYTLGLPGAATVTAGSIVSFRLVDPANGGTLLTGIVRCAVPPTRYQSVSSKMVSPIGMVVCSRIAA